MPHTAVRHCCRCFGDLPATAVSCMECGHLLEPELMFDDEQWTVCRRSDCRYLNSAGARFCAGCAYPLGLPAGTEIGGRYRIEQQVYGDSGHGGFSFGPIYRAVDVKNELAPVALREFTCCDQERFQLGLPFFRSAWDKLNLLQNSPLVPKVFDYIEEPTAAYIVTEYLSGPSLGALVDEMVRPFPFDWVVELGEGLCDLLELMHSQRPPLLKRDLPLDDLMINSDGNATAVNLGLAWRTPNVWTSSRIRVY